MVLKVEKGNDLLCGWGLGKGFSRRRPWVVEGTIGKAILFGEGVTGMKEALWTGFVMGAGKS